MLIRAPAIVCSVRPHGETGAIAQVLTAAHGLVSGYVPGGRGRQMRPVLMPGNTVSAELRARSESQLPSLKVELLTSRGAWLGEPLAATAIGWATALTAGALPDRQAYPALHEALGALLEAICHAPSARGWTAALVAYEALLLRELGYGRGPVLPAADDFAENLALFDRLGPALARYALAHRRTDVMAARAILRERLGKIG